MQEQLSEHIDRLFERAIGQDRDAFRVLRAFSCNYPDLNLKAYRLAARTAVQLMFDGPGYYEHVHRCMADGDSITEGAFYERLKSLGMGTVVPLVGNKHEAEDIVQNTLVRVCCSLRASSLTNRADSPKSYFVKAFVNAANSHRRGQARRRTLLEKLGFDLFEERASVPSTPEEDAHRRSLGRKIDRIVSRLPGLEQQMVLSVADGLELQEFAVLTNKNYNTVKSAWRRLQVKLKKELSRAER